MPVANAGLFFVCGFSHGVVSMLPVKVADQCRQ
jgi:hypothetical protein